MKAMIKIDIEKLTIATPSSLNIATNLIKAQLDEAVYAMTRYIWKRGHEMEDLDDTHIINIVLAEDNAVKLLLRPREEEDSLVDGISIKKDYIEIVKA